MSETQTKTGTKHCSNCGHRDGSPVIQVGDRRCCTCCVDGDVHGPGLAPGRGW